MCEDHANDHETDKSPNLKSIDYCVLDPTGNITILVTSSVPVHLQPQIASQLMNLEPEAEQVGFLSRDDSCDIALRMAGGEFCGNASMCAAVYAASEAGTVSSDVILRVSEGNALIRRDSRLIQNIADSSDLPASVQDQVNPLVIPAGSVTVWRHHGMEAFIFAAVCKGRGLIDRLPVIRCYFRKR